MSQLIFKNRKRGFQERGTVLRGVGGGGPVLRSFSEGGFTLIEILIVVGIIGLTMTLGVPAFVKAMQREGMRKAQFELLQACRDARSKAITNTNSTYQDLIFNPLGRTFQAPGGTLATLPDNVVIDLLGINEIDYAQEESARVRFFRNGTSDEFIIVVHSLKDGSQSTITLDPVTALVEVSPQNEPAPDRSFGRGSAGFHPHRSHDRRGDLFRGHVCAPGPAQLRHPCRLHPAPQRPHRRHGRGGIGVDGDQQA